MHLGIDGNEANVLNRVGSNSFAHELIAAINTTPTIPDQTTVYLKSRPLNDLPAPSPHWRYRVLQPGFFWTQWRLPLDLFQASLRPDVFFTPGHYAPRFCPIPHIITILDLAFLKFPNLFLRHKRGFHQLKAWTDYSVRQASHILAISQNTKKDIIAAYHLPPESVSVVYPGIDLKRYQPASLKQQRRVCQQYHLPRRFILSVGTIQPRKNYPRLLQAFASLPPRYQSLHLVIVGGRGWLTDAFEATIKKVNLGPRLHLLGFIPDSDLVSLYSASACTALPGIYEGFGLPAAQALSCGSLPVVSQTASLPEVVGSAGILVDPYSVQSIRRGIIKALKLTQPERRRLLYQGQKHLAQFSWQLAARQVIEVCHALTLH